MGIPYIFTNSNLNILFCGVYWIYDLLGDKSKKEKMRLIKLFKEFSNFYKILMIGFVGGILAWIFSYTFEDLLTQLNNFWKVFFASLFLALIWSFILGFCSFLILKLLGMNFEK